MVVSSIAALPTLETVRGLTYVAANGTIKRAWSSPDRSPDFSATRHRVEITLCRTKAGMPVRSISTRMNVDNPLVDSIEAEITFNLLGGYTLVVSKVRGVDKDGARDGDGDSFGRRAWTAGWRSRTRRRRRLK